MRISLIYLGRRGAGGKISLELARVLSGGHDVSIALSRQAEGLVAWEELHLECIMVDTYRGAFSALVSLIFSFRIQCTANRIRQVAPDVLLFPMFHPWNALIQKNLGNIPSVVFVHDPRPHPDLVGWFYEKLENASIRRASRCIVLSEALRPHLVQRGADSARIDVVPLGVFSYSQDSEQAASPDRYEEANASAMVLFFGRIAPYKGLDILLKACARLRGSTDFRLLLAGEGNLAPYAELLKAVPNLDIINRWIAEDEVASFFERADLVVLPYTSASQSGVIPIAASFGLPVIATREGGLAEQVVDGVSGWLVEAGNDAALADAMREALSNREVARRRGAALKTRFETDLGWEQNVRRLEKCLELAVAARGPK